MSSGVTYYRDLGAYGDGKFLYLSTKGITRGYLGIGRATLRSYFKRPDLVVEHWGGFCAGTLRLYRMDLVRRRFGRYRMDLVHFVRSFRRAA